MLLVSRKKGFSLLVTLIALVVMMLAGMALLRMVDTQTSLATNISLKQSSILAAGAAVANARDWIHNNPTLLSANSLGNGYMAFGLVGADNQNALVIPGLVTLLDSDPDGIEADWDNNTAALNLKPRRSGPDSAGNSYAYVVQRLCSASSGCLQNLSNSLGGSGTLHEGQAQGDENTKDSAYTSGRYEYYRVYVRVSGPRNTVSFVEITLREGVTS